MSYSVINEGDQTYKHTYLCHHTIWRRYQPKSQITKVGIWTGSYSIWILFQDFEYLRSRFYKLFSIYKLGNQWDVLVIFFIRLPLLFEGEKRLPVGLPIYTFFVLPQQSWLKQFSPTLVRRDLIQQSSPILFQSPGLGKRFWWRQPFYILVSKR